MPRAVQNGLLPDLPAHLIAMPRGSVVDTPCLFEPMELEDVGARAPKAFQLIDLRILPQASPTSL